MHLETVIASLIARPGVTIAVGAFLSGVALFYLVMQRTRKHRIRQAEERQGL